jgi:large conductance mechanosensitive channel
MLRDLRDFVSGRHVTELIASIALAIAVFQLVHSLVHGFVLTPLSFTRGAGFGGNAPLTFTVGGDVFYYGDLLGYAITLALLGLLLLLVVRLGRARLWDDVPLRDCPFCLTEIPAAATVCGACGRELAVGGPVSGST